jgi:hypothetical protein
MPVASIVLHNGQAVQVPPGPSYAPGQPHASAPHPGETPVVIPTDCLPSTPDTARLAAAARMMGPPPATVGPDTVRAAGWIASSRPGSMRAGTPQPKIVRVVEGWTARYADGNDVRTKVWPVTDGGGCVLVPYPRAEALVVLLHVQEDTGKDVVAVSTAIGGTEVGFGGTPYRAGGPFDTYLALLEADPDANIPRAVLVRCTAAIAEVYAHQVPFTSAPNPIITPVWMR